MENSAPEYDGKVTRWNQEVRGGRILAKAAEPTVEGDLLRMRINVGTADAAGALTPGRHLLLVDSSGTVCEPAVDQGPTNGIITVNNHSWTKTNLAFRVPAGADPQDYSLVIVDASGAAVGRIATGSPEPLTRPDDQCPGYRLENPLLQATPAMFGDPADITIAGKKFGSITMAAPKPGAAKKSRKGADRPRLSTSFTATSGSEQLQIQAGATMAFDDEGNMCPLWSVNGQDPEFTSPTGDGRVELEFVGNSETLPDDLHIKMLPGYEDPAAQESLALVWGSSR